ncbi:MAG: putative Ig domain-containing protein, partial [Planctomycetota bacterium]
MPAGLSLNSTTGEISGTPTTAETANFTVEVTDSQTPTPDSDTQALSIDVAPEDLVITTSSLPDGTVAVAYSQTLAATGGVTPYSWAVV